MPKQGLQTRTKREKGTRVFSEADAEGRILDILEEMGYNVIRSGASRIAGDEESLRSKYNEVVLENRLRDALVKINPNMPIDSIDDAVKQIVRSKSQDIYEDNKDFHNILVNGVTVSVNNNGNIDMSKYRSLIQIIPKIMIF